MYTEAKMNSAVRDGLPQCPSGLLFCEVTRRDGLSDKGPYGSGELLWQQSRRKLLPHPGAPASAAGAFLFLEPCLLGPNVSPPTLASLEASQ